MYSLLSLQAVEEVHRNAFYLGTKVGRYEKDIYKMFDYSAERSIACVDSSLQRLGVKYVDLIQ
ncbi:jg15957, partial [Pararge aegeria aegeria]